MFGMPAAELAESSVRLEDVVGRVARSLREELEGYATWPERFAAVERVVRGLMRRHESGRDAVPEVAQAWRLIRCGGGRTPVAGVASDVGWSTRHLEQRFRGRVRHHAQGRRCGSPGSSARSTPRATRAGGSPTSPPSAGMRTRRTWRGSGVTWPACHRRGGASRTTSHSSKTTRPRCWQHRGHDRHALTTTSGPGSATTTRTPPDLAGRTRLRRGHLRRVLGRRPARRPARRDPAQRDALAGGRPGHGAHPGQGRRRLRQRTGHRQRLRRLSTTRTPSGRGREALGVRVFRPMEDTDYGSRGFSIADAEGNPGRSAPTPATTRPPAVGQGPEELGPQPSGVVVGPAVLVEPGFGAPLAAERLHEEPHRLGPRLLLGHGLALEVRRVRGMPGQSFEDPRQPLGRCRVVGDHRLGGDADDEEREPDEVPVRSLPAAQWTTTAPSASPIARRAATTESGRAVEIAEVVLRPVRVVLALFLRRSRTASGLAVPPLAGRRTFAAVPMLRSVSHGRRRSPAGIPVSLVSSV